MAPGPEPTDGELVDAANCGDRRAFGALYERHREFVHAVAWRLTGDADLAAETVQETFLWWLGRFPGFELRVKATSFLYTVARSVAIDLGRRRRRTLRALDDEALPAGLVPAASVDAALADAVARLPFGQQEVLLLRYGHGLELADIAQALGVPVGTVKSRLHLAARALRAAGEP